MDPFNDTISHLVSRWQQADKVFLRQLFPLLAEGKPVSPKHLVDITGRDIAAVEEALDKGRTTRDRNGDVTEVFGISLGPACHRIRVGEVTLHSCCALVAQMVPFFLGRNVTIESVDPLNNKLITVEISPNGIQSVAPSSAVGILVVTEHEGILEDVRSAFCSHVNYSSDPVSAQLYADKDPRRYVVTVEHFNDVALRLYSAIWETL